MCRVPAVIAHFFQELGYPSPHPLSSQEDIFIKICTSDISQLAQGQLWGFIFFFFWVCVASVLIGFHQCEVIRAQRNKRERRDCMGRERAQNMHLSRGWRGPVTYQVVSNLVSSLVKDSCVSSTVREKVTDHSFTPLPNKHLLSAYCVRSTVLPSVDPEWR